MNPQHRARTHTPYSVGALPGAQADWHGAMTALGRTAQPAAGASPPGAVPYPSYSNPTLRSPKSELASQVNAWDSGAVITTAFVEPDYNTVTGMQAEHIAQTMYRDDENLGRSEQNPAFAMGVD